MPIETTSLFRLCSNCRRSKLNSEDKFEVKSKNLKCFQHIEKPTYSTLISPSNIYDKLLSNSEPFLSYSQQINFKFSLHCSCLVPVCPLRQLLLRQGVLHSFLAKSTKKWLILFWPGPSPILQTAAVSRHALAVRQTERQTKRETA